MRTEGVFAEQTRAFLVRLSGWQMKRSTPVTAPALLAGLHTCFATLETLKHYSPDELLSSRVAWAQDRDELCRYSSTSSEGCEQSLRNSLRVNDYFPVVYDVGIHAIAVGSALT
jgi:Na+/H+ antiporter NhaB